MNEMERADGFVLVFPEYNHGYPGALKNILDALKDEWVRKPFALVSTGGISGGMRASENLLPVLQALQGMPVRASVAVQGVNKGWAHDGPDHDEAAWRERFGAMFADLERWARALTRARTSEQVTLVSA